MTCVVPGCSIRKGTEYAYSENISFHRFPADTELQKEWIRNVKRADDWRPSIFSRICSLHFEGACYREGYARKMLHSHAVPTIFVNHPAACQPKLKRKRKYVAKYVNQETATSTPEMDAEAAAQQTHLVPKRSRGSQTEDISGSVKEINKMSKILQKYKLLAVKRGTKLRSTLCKCSRLVNKMADLEFAIYALYQERKGNTKLDREGLQVHLQKAFKKNDCSDDIVKIEQDSPQIELNNAAPAAYSQETKNISLHRTRSQNIVLSLQNNGVSSPVKFKKYIQIKHPEVLRKSNFENSLSPSLSLLPMQATKRKIDERRNEVVRGRPAISHFPGMATPGRFSLPRSPLAVIRAAQSNRSVLKIKSIL